MISTKKITQSKTFWFNLIALIILVLISLIAGCSFQINLIGFSIFGVVNIILRFVTNKKISLG